MPNAEDDIALDINYLKLPDWLIERKKLSKNWQESVRTIRSQITDSLTKLPDVPEIVEVFITYSEMTSFIKK